PAKFNSIKPGSYFVGVPKRVARIEENVAADRVKLSAEQIERLNNLTPAAGERHDEGNMAVIDR
ncbi:MAG TPA: hypothetical protein PLR37_16650, partial [Candidatus Accumulibacter phosphatis]|nr:hypothetical protein [Candidatus Accumulibacter phosphatis]